MCCPHFGSCCTSSVQIVCKLPQRVLLVESVPLILTTDFRHLHTSSNASRKLVCLQSARGWASRGVRAATGSLGFGLCKKRIPKSEVVGGEWFLMMPAVGVLTCVGQGNSGFSSLPKLSWSRCWLCEYATADEKVPQMMCSHGSRPDCTL